MAQVQP